MRKYVVVVFENEKREFNTEVAYVKGPFDRYEDARGWADTAECAGEFQIILIRS